MTINTGGTLSETAAETIAYGGNLELARAATIALLRKHVEGVGADRWLAPEIQKAYELVADGSIMAAAQTVTGELE